MAAVTATLRYARADNDALQTEKAYILNYPAPPGVPKSNFDIDFYPEISIDNLRTAALTYDHNGLTIAEVEDCMSKSDFEDEEKVEKIYLPAVHRCIQKALKVKEIYIFDYMIRRREPGFPYQPVGRDERPQPALSAHIDYTTAEIDFRLEKYFKEKSKEFGRRKFQIINVWKPLAGPLRDYPMAYCDAKSMNAETDLLAVDEVFPTVANEVYQVLHNPNHKWYYIPDQLPTEVAIFAGYDSKRRQELAVPHCSFDLGKGCSGDPRESIEVRAFVFYDDQEALLQF